MLGASTSGAGLPLEDDGPSGVPDSREEVDCDGGGATCISAPKARTPANKAMLHFANPQRGKGMARSPGTVPAGGEAEAPKRPGQAQPRDPLFP
jgi:hypothetical protein